MQIRELCNSPIQTVAQTETLAHAAGAMRAGNVSSLLVSGNGDFVGILSERDLVQAIADRASLRRTLVSEYMTSEIFGVHGDLDAADAASLMLEKGVRHLPVLEGGDVIGMVSTRDLLFLEAWPPA